MPSQPRFISGLILLIISIVLSTSSLPKIYSTAAAENKTVPNIVVIKFKESLSIESNTIQTTNNKLNTLLDKQSVTSLTPVLKSKSLRKVNPHVYDLSHIYYATFSGNRSAAEVAAVIESNPAIIYAEPKYIYYVNAIPNDSLYYRQDVYYDLIKAPQAWDIIRGSDSNVVIAIVDGGTDIAHPDLGTNIWSNEAELGPGAQPALRAGHGRRGDTGQFLGRQRGRAGGPPPAGAWRYAGALGLARSLSLCVHDNGAPRR